MKNETARREIESLDYYLQNYTNDYSEESHTAMMMAIKALEQEPCDDCISRQAVMDCFKKWQTYMATRLWDFEQELSALPLVTPQPKTGYWTRELIRNEKGGCIGAKRICTRCGKDNKHDEYMNFCPNCGARMNKENPVEV